MPKLPAEQAIQRVRDGDDFRIEREDAHLINRTTGKVRHECGVRVWLQKPNGRWEPTALWMLGPTEKAKNGEPMTIFDSLHSLVAVLDPETGAGER